jgi:hypothetical protein
MKLRLIVAAIVLALTASACYDLATEPSPELPSARHTTSDGSTVPPDTTKRGGGSMGNGN